MKKKSKFYIRRKINIKRLNEFLYINCLICKKFSFAVNKLVHNVFVVVSAKCLFIVFFCLKRCKEKEKVIKEKK